MAVTSKFGAVRNTTGGSFVAQTVGGVVFGNAVIAAGPLTKGLSILDALTLNANSGYDALPRLRASGIYTTKKIISGGDFAYNAAKANTWVISRITTSLAGVANTTLLFMASNNVRPMAEFKHDFGVKMLTAYRALRFANTGRKADGTAVSSRVLWLNADGTAAALPTTLTTVNMVDLRDGDATDKAVDDAASSSRAIPGELVIRNDFVTAGLSGGNFFNYKPITGL